MEVVCTGPDVILTFSAPGMIHKNNVRVFAKSFVFMQTNIPVLYSETKKK